MNSACATEIGIGGGKRGELGLFSYDCEHLFHYIGFSSNFHDDDDDYSVIS